MIFISTDLRNGKTDWSLDIEIRLKLNFYYKSELNNDFRISFLYVICKVWLPRIVAFWHYTFTSGNNNVVNIHEKEDPSFFGKWWRNIKENYRKLVRVKFDIWQWYDGTKWLREYVNILSCTVLKIFKRATVVQNG